MKTIGEEKTFRFVMFHNNLIVCERVWQKDETVKLTKIELELEFDEVVKIIDEYLNKDYQDGEIIHTYTIMYEDAEVKHEKEIGIRKRPWKELYSLDIRPKLQEIRDRLKLGFMYYLKN